MSNQRTTKKLKTLATLRRNDCRWPIGDPRLEGFHFCGAPQLAGRPYCELHWRMAVQPPRSRESQSLPAQPVPRAA